MGLHWRSDERGSGQHVASDSLNLHIGDPLVLVDTTGQGTARHSVRVIGYMEEKSLLVTTPRVRGAPLLVKEGQVFGVRLRESNRVVGFTTHVIKAHQSPFPYLHLHPPAEMESIVVRGEPRVSMQMLVSVARLEGDQLASEARPMMLNDLSTTGCRLLGKAPIAESGSRVRIAARLRVADASRDLVLKGVVRSVSLLRAEEGEDDDHYQHGIAFTEREDDALIVLEAVLYEHMVRQLEPGIR